MTKPECFDTDGQFVRFAVEYELPNTIQHWQLRDLVSFGADDVHVFTVNGQHVQRYNLESRKVETFTTCHQAPGPTSLAVNGRYLATGTDRGSLAVYSMSNPEKAPVKIFEHAVSEGGDVLNSLHIVNETSNMPARLYASLNDSTVRCFSLPTMTQLCRLEHDVAVNYCAESPDASCLVTVGDNKLVSVFHRNSTGALQLTNTLFSEAMDAGMCCSWNQWGSTFATAHQCGHVLVWDARTCGRPVQSLKVGSAVRTVKYCSAPVDLMAFAEHEGVFHVVDARKYRTRQTVRHSDNHAAGISGIAFAPGGTRLLVGVENRGIQEWAVDSTDRRGFSGSLAS